MTTQPHENSTAATLKALVENIADALTVDLRTARGKRLAGAMRDAFELGKLAPTASHPVAASSTPVHDGDRAGMVAQVVHTVTPAAIAKYGVEDAVLAFTRQALRELAQNGARPEVDATVQYVGMLDGTIVVTAEGKVGA